MSAASLPPRETSQLLAWLRLMRAPNVFTAIADVAMGFLVVRGHLDPVPWGLLICLAAASALLYTAGMVLNDVFDFEVDLRERPFRPLPAGQISLPLARAIGLAMLVAGVLLGGLAGFAYAAPIPWRSGLVALLLAGCVLLYDAWLKRFPVGPLGMGLCRFFNVLLGMSAAANVADGWPLGLGPMHLLPAAGIGIYVTGITIFARGEAGRSSALWLVPGLIVMVAGIGVLGWAGEFFAAPQVKPPMFWLLLAVLALTIVRRALVAVYDPSPLRVQAAVKNAIFSLVVLDAAVVLAAGSSWYAVGVLLLLVPMVVLGRWVYST